MAKSQKRSNREIRKPKQVKAAAQVVPEGLLSRPNASATLSSRKRA